MASKSDSNSNNSNKNNGLITKIWGGAGWVFEHSITFGYPLEPTDDKKMNYMKHFQLLGEVLPCKYCRESYNKIISEGDTVLNLDVMESRETLSKWFYRVHEAVNKRLGVDYGVTYEDVVARYESCRAQCGNSDTKVHGCVSPLDYKSFSYKKINQIDCPIYPLSISGPFVLLAKARGLSSDLFKFYDLMSEKSGNYSQIKNTEDWIARNKYCREQIIKMRESGSKSMETDGPWIGTPTTDELKLLIHMSSNLNKQEIVDCIQNLVSNPNYLSLIKSVY